MFSCSNKTFGETLANSNMCVSVTVGRSNERNIFFILVIHIFKRFKPGIDLILCRASCKIFDPYCSPFPVRRLFPVLIGKGMFYDDCSGKRQSPGTNMLQQLHSTNNEYIRLD